MRNKDSSSTPARQSHWLIRFVLWIPSALIHAMGANTGRIETWTRQDGNVMVGFRCDLCGKLHGVHPAPMNKDYSQNK